MPAQVLVAHPETGGAVPYSIGAWPAPGTAALAPAAPRDRRMSMLSTGTGFQGDTRRLTTVTAGSSRVPFSLLTAHENG